MNGNMFWFPALITVFLFLAALAIEHFSISEQGTYTALAITSVIFGLVHFHSGSIIFVGLASIGGWAYGYTYIKTKNVFYAALVHALVNSSHLIFGIELLKSNLLLVNLNGYITYIFPEPFSLDLYLKIRT